MSSDGKTISAGANFLKRIEEGLINCTGAIYLISPISVKRNWINFELGAIWIRNVSSINNNGPAIPTIPFCHSGIKPSNLPMPLINLNAIQANNSAQLENAFMSIQSAVGGKGRLKTNFDKLAQSIALFENQYTLGDNLISLFKTIGVNRTTINDLLQHCKNIGVDIIIPCEFKEVDYTLISSIKELENNALNGKIRIDIQNPRLAMGPNSMGNFCDITIHINVRFILNFENELLKAFV